MHTVELACKKTPRAAGTAGGMTDTYRRGIGMANVSPEMRALLVRLNGTGTLPCTKCGEIKPLDQFRKNAKAAKLRHGLRSHCNSCVDAYARAMYLTPARHAETLARSRVRARQVKLDIIAAYGGACVCCGEAHPAFLTLDHINGGGTQLRKNGGMKVGSPLYYQLRREGFPQGELQLLCMNCNFAKGHWGHCPHEGRELGFFSSNVVVADN